MAAFFWREPSQKQNVSPRLKAPVKDPVRRPPLTQEASVRHVRGVHSVSAPVVHLASIFHRTAFSFPELKTSRELCDMFP